MKSLNPIFIALLLLTNPIFGQEDTLTGTKRAWYECTEPIAIDTNFIELKTNELYFQINLDQAPKNLKEHNFYWLEDNPEGYFTAYLVNTKKSEIVVDRQDGSVMMIQEAMNKNGEWQPIEHWVRSGCGNSYFDPLHLANGQCSMIPIKQYSGSFATSFRLKLKNGTDIIYSESFNGTIDPAQFNKVTKTVHGVLYSGRASYFEME